MSELIKAVVVDSLYIAEDRTNDEGNFAVLYMKQGDKKFKAVGNLTTSFRSIKGLEVKLTGDWRVREGEKQFMFSEMKVDPDRLILRSIPGISAANVNEILFKMSLDSFFKIVENNPSILKGSIKGIGDKKLEKIVNTYRKKRELFSLYRLLLPLGITERRVDTIYKFFKNEMSIEDISNAIRENPYILKKVDRIGFKLADKIARKMGISENDSRRIRAVIETAIEEKIEQKGDTLIKVEDFLSVITSYVELDIREIKQYIKEMIQNDELKFVKESLLLTTTEYYNIEHEIYRTVLDRAENSSRQLLDREKLESEISLIEQEMGITFNRQQKRVLELLNRTDFLAVTGSAGTGKTTVSRAIYSLIADLYGSHSVVTTALSAIAVDRIRKVTGNRESYTIHYLLNRYKRSGLGYKAIIIDESSMIDSKLMLDLLRIIPKDCQVVMLGDVGQLPAIQPGAPFRDILHILDSLNLSVRLEEPVRQSLDSPILRLATEVREQHVEKDTLKPLAVDISDKNIFYTKNETEKQQLKQQLKDRIEEKLLEFIESEKNSMFKLIKEKDMKSYISSMQVITPMRKGQLGADNLNRKIQQLFWGDRDKSFRVGEKKFYTGDRVVHSKNSFLPTLSANDYKKYGGKLVLEDSDSFEFEEEKIANGERGIIVSMNSRGDKIAVLYPFSEKVAIYDSFAAENLDLAYALTVHKLQGSEVDRLYMLLTSSHYSMLDRKMIYTAVTRAKQDLKIIGEIDLINRVIKHEGSERKTVISHILIKDELAMVDLQNSPKTDPGI